MKLEEPYRPRRISCKGVRSTEGFRLKLYTISYAEAPNDNLISQAMEIATQTLKDKEGHGAGFLCVHKGKGASVIFVDWWSHENELHHEIFLDDGTRAGFTACAWDLALICFERDAWVRCVLSNPSGPDVEQYLSEQLNADI